MGEYILTLGATDDTPRGTGKVTITSKVVMNDRGQMAAMRYAAVHEDGTHLGEWYGDNPGAYIRSLGYDIEYTSGE